MSSFFVPFLFPEKYVYDAREVYLGQSIQYADSLGSTPLSLVVCASPPLAASHFRGGASLFFHQRDA